MFPFKKIDLVQLRFSVSQKRT